ncbi:hypothetical protein AA700_0041 [Acidiphilium acidophilum DSM 700]|nr:hypothetical protein AA700_0041 [Acidiphilium acidophilum DSM 700]
MRLEATKRPITDIIEPDVVDREPSRKMASAIRVIADSQIRVAQRSKLVCKCSDPWGEVAGLHGPWCPGQPFNDVHDFSPCAGLALEIA